MKEIVIKPPRTHNFKPLYVKIKEILEEISVNINNIRPIVSPSLFPPWHTNRIEVNTELKTFDKNCIPHRQIINSFYEIINYNFNNFYHIYNIQMSQKPQNKPALLSHISHKISCSNFLNLRASTQETS
jgi:hypothetical protein